MAHYRRIGEVPPKRHTQHRDPEGRLYYEELMGEEGFSSDSSLLYHRGVPSAIVASEVWALPDQTRTPNHPLKPRHLRLHDLETGGDAVTDRRLVLGNGDVRLSYVVAGPEPSAYYRNAIGDECVYVESGTGVVETVFGVVGYRAGDYVVIPRATTHRWVPAPGSPEPSRLYAIEANSHIAPPKRYLSRYGQLLEHAPYCERDLYGPTQPVTMDGADVEVLVKHRTSAGIVGTRLTYATHPFDVVGWDGCLYPYTLNIEDYMPITGKVHQPPPVHQVFEGHHFVICNFLPRKVDYHPLARRRWAWSTSRSRRSWSTRSPRSSWGRAGSPSRTRRTPGAGAVVDRTAGIRRCSPTAEPVRLPQGGRWVVHVWVLAGGGWGTAGLGWSRSASGGRWVVHVRSRRGGG